MRRRQLHDLLAQTVVHNRSPTSADDSGQGYTRGIRWLDTSATPVNEYVLVDSTLGTAVWRSATGGGGGAAVTSVGLTVPAFLTQAVGPITNSGTFAIGLAAQVANTIFAGPGTGVSTAPTFRALVAADIPSLDAAKVTSGLLGTAVGGTGVDSHLAANGALLIGNSAGFSLAVPTASNGLSITVGAGTLLFAATYYGLIEALPGHVPTPTAQTLYVLPHSWVKYSLDKISIRTAGGTISASVQINGVVVGALGSLAVTSTDQVVSSTSANTINPGDEVKIVLTSPVSVSDLRFNIQVTRIA